jgi:hypothetical protein
MNNKKSFKRLAYSLAEFAKLMGHHRGWAYRQVSEGRIKTINGFGRAMISAEEVDRVLNSSEIERQAITS